MRMYRTRDRADRGQSLVEFALVIPIFLLIVIGLFDVGRAVFAYNTVSNAARAAARVAIVNQDTTAVEARAREMAPGLDNRLTVSQEPCSVRECDYVVTVTYDYEPATPLIGRLFNPTIASTASMQVEFPNP